MAAGTLDGCDCSGGIIVLAGLSHESSSSESGGLALVMLAVIDGLVAVVDSLMASAAVLSGTKVTAIGGFYITQRNRGNARLRVVVVGQKYDALQVLGCLLSWI